MGMGMNVTAHGLDRAADFEWCESLKHVADSYFNVERNNPEILQNIADSYFSIELNNQRACNICLR